MIPDLGRLAEKVNHRQAGFPQLSRPGVCGGFSFSLQGCPAWFGAGGGGGVSRDALIRGQFSHIIPNLKLSQLLVSVA